MPLNTQESLIALAARTCPHCGRPKQPGVSLCPTDYFRLPHVMRMAVYRKAGSGYAEAVSDALEYLAEHFPVDAEVMP